VICDVEVVMVPDSQDDITRVLENVNATGVLGNFSVVLHSLTVVHIPGNLGILVDLGHVCRR
jgi:hypothetical protein